MKTAIILIWLGCSILPFSSPTKITWLQPSDPYLPGLRPDCTNITTTNPNPTTNLNTKLLVSREQPISPGLWPTETHLNPNTPSTPTNHPTHTQTRNHPIQNHTQSRNHYTSSSMYKSNRGFIHILDQSRPNDPRIIKEYYYIYAYQYVYLKDGQLVRENHQFSFQGYLRKGGKPQLTGLSACGNYMFYENDLYELKIPINDQGNIWFRQKGTRPMHVMGSQGWVCLAS